MDSKNTRNKYIAAALTLAIQLMIIGILNIDFQGITALVPLNFETEEFEIPLEQMIEDLSAVGQSSTAQSSDENQIQETINTQAAPDQPAIKESTAINSLEAEEIKALEEQIQTKIPTPEPKKVVLLDPTNDTVFNAEVQKIIDKKKLKNTVYRDNQAYADRMDFYLKNKRAVYNILKVYPYALKTRNLIDSLNTQLSGMKNESDKKALIDEAEKTLFKEYEAAVRNMSRSQGEVLLKLIYRETHKTGYDIIKGFKGGFSATFWYGVGRLFKTDLKTEYDQKEDSIYEQVIERYNKGEYR